MPLRLPGQAVLNFGEHIIAGAANVAAKEIFYGNRMHDDFAWRRLLGPLFGRRSCDEGDTIEQGLQMIKDVGSPALKLHLDTFHMNIEEKDQGRAIRKAGKLLGHFHACGSDRGTPGNDHIDWQPIAAALKAVKYQGDVVIESFTTDVKVIARAAAIWRRIEPTRDEIAVKGIRFLKKIL